MLSTPECAPGHDAHLLIAALHRRALLLLDEARGQHFQGLAQAGRALGLSSLWRRRLANWDFALGLAEKISSRSIDFFIAGLEQELVCAAGRRRVSVPSADKVNPDVALAQSGGPGTVETGSPTDVVMHVSKKLRLDDFTPGVCVLPVAEEFQHRDKKCKTMIPTAIKEDDPPVCALVQEAGIEMVAPSSVASGFAVEDIKIGFRLLQNGKSTMKVLRSDNHNPRLGWRLCYEDDPQHGFHVKPPALVEDIRSGKFLVLDQLVSVHSQDKSTGESNLAAITNEKGHLPQAQIDRMVQMVVKYRAEHETNKHRIEAKNALEKYCFTMQNTMQEEKLKEKIEAGIRTLSRKRSRMFWIGSTRTSWRRKMSLRQSRRSSKVLSTSSWGERRRRGRYINTRSIDKDDSNVLGGLQCFSVT